MASRVGKLVLGVLLGVLLAGMIFSGGVALGATLPQLQEAARSWLPMGAGQPQATASALTENARQALFAPFWQAWDIVHQDYVDQPVDDQALMQGAIRGMIDALGDEHSSYMDPEEYRQANIPIEGSYEGIGAWVDTEGEFLTIIAPMPGSPAEQAGLLPGDQVIALDGESMTGVDPSLVVRRVLGPAGTTVHLTIRREGVDEPLEFDIIRARITIPSLEDKMLEGDIAYIHLLAFGGETVGDLRRALRDLLDQQPRGLILDLRGNGGGLLDAALQVTSEFVPEGVIMIEQYGDGRQEIYRADPGGLATEIPLVVLIDGGSASASEIVAGAIQDRGRGLLVGETSFGKGSVQNWVPLTDDAGAVRITVARWLTPNGRQIDGVGLTPDIVVELTQDDVLAARDPQLDRAVELLTSESTP
ncbi:MAG: S41 family peptidase [Chloroflexota bacterium]